MTEEPIDTNKNMNRHIIKTLLAAASISVVAACTKDVQGGLSVDIGIAGQSTRTSLGEQTGTSVPVLWSEGDVISLNGIVSTPLTAAESGRSEATFHFKGSITAPYNFLYCGVNGQDATVLFNAAQAFTSGNIPTATLPMYASCDGLSDVGMHHLGAILRFGFTGNGENIVQVKTSTMNNESLSGKFSLSKTPDGKLSAVLTPAGSNTASIMAEGSAVLSATPTSFLVVVPAGTYARGFSGNIVTSDGSTMLVHFNTKDNKTLAAGTLYDFGAASFVSTGKSEMTVCTTQNFNVEEVSYE